MWFLEKTTRFAIEKAYSAGLMPTAKQQDSIDAIFAQSDRVSSTSQNTSTINVHGVLTKAPDFYSFLFGGGNTLYSEIISAIHEADADENIDNIVLDIDSPGGQIDGLFDALAVIRSAKKPIKAVVSNMAASAAYAIAAQADKIEALNGAARFGSVGVVATFYADENEISITSTEAPNKRPDIMTDDGKSVVREELDAIHELFAKAISDGRGVSVEKVNADFGRGSVVVAADALKRGMVDSVSDPLENNNQLNQENKKMDIETLKAKHQDVYLAALKEGKEQELDRVNAHLISGEASGDLKTAFEAIKDGSGMTATLQATYMAAGMANRDLANRQEDDVDASVVDGVTASEDQPDQAEIVASLVESKLGLGE